MHLQHPEGSVVSEVLKGSSSHKVVNDAKTSVFPSDRRYVIAAL